MLHFSLIQLAQYQGKIIYLIQHDQQMFCSDSLQLFNLYKRFVQSTIIQLGEDWRIESGLLAQEIMTEKSLTQDQFCIFNELMAGFLKKRLRQEAKTVTQTSQMGHGQEDQEEFLEYFNKSLNSNDTISSQDFSGNLTFKTLSLGFYITATDIWAKNFLKIRQNAIEDQFNRFSINNQNMLQYFATFQLSNQKFFREPQASIRSMINQFTHQINGHSGRSSQLLSNAIKLGSIVVNISETIIRQDLKPFSIQIRTFSLCRQFYLKIFLIWLIFSIKKSFNSTLFSSTCFVRYCDIIISPCIFKSQKENASYYTLYKQFKLLCDDEWRKLMKDYMIALNNDKQVLKILIKRIQQKIKERFKREIQGKKTKIQSS